MKITNVETFLLHVPVTGMRVADAMHQLTNWGVVGTIIHTDTGLRGFGYTGTHAHLGTDRLMRDCIRLAYAPLLMGEDPSNVREVWQKLYDQSSIRWVGRAGITQMALAAVDIALWDLKAKAAEMPLWKLLGGSPSKRLEAFHGDAGWINWTVQQLVEAAKAATEEGFRGLKLKVGHPDLLEDLQRIEAVRKAVDPRIKVAVDANGRWDLAAATRVGRCLKEFDIVWFEEPLWLDDVAGHAALARRIDTPIALGEQLYSIDAFKQFIEAGAVQIVQPDVTRLGGITPWLQVADLALACRLPVVPHVGDMMQVHLHLGLAHPACNLLEYIPWLRICFEEPATVKEGLFEIPEHPGAGTTIKPERIVRFGLD
ncbi:MAG: mandelate racemase/muconate lactonizing enzyme family protein [Thermoguttaceae bacterium]